jgi:hypothetical protein
MSVPATDSGTRLRGGIPAMAFETSMLPELTPAELELVAGGDEGDDEEHHHDEGDHHEGDHHEGDHHEGEHHEGDHH